MKFLPALRKRVPETLPASMVLDTVSQVYAGQMMNRGLTNQLSGMGGQTDKSVWFKYVPHWLNDRQMIENVCNLSWLAERFIDMPVDDMFAKPRIYDSNKRFKKAFKDLKIDTRAASAIKLSRKYGTGLLWLVSKEAKPEVPLNLNAIRKGDVVNAVAIDRNDVSVKIIDKNVMSPNFGQPEIYTLHVHQFGSIDVHYTRIYRWDGQTADTINGWQQYEKDWGVSSLASVMQEVFNDSTMISAITHLIQEASIPVHKVDGLAEIMCRGKAAADEQNVDDIMKQVNMYKSIYRTIFMDSDNEFDRTSVNFSNIPELMVQFEERFAMSSGVSTTRFLGKSASGLNATGEGDQRNDSKSTRIRQTRMLEPFYDWVDPIIARSVGGPAPEYEFPPLFEMSEKETSDIDLARSRAAKLMVDNGSWSPKEAKDYLATGTLPAGSLDPAAERTSFGGTNDPEGETKREVVKEGEDN